MNRPPRDNARLPLQVLRLWDADPATARSVGTGEQRVFDFAHDGGRRYLRLTPAELRARPALEAEIDFVRYLARGGLSVATPVPSRRGQYIEAIEPIDGRESQLHATVFEEARGEAFRYDATADNRAHFRLRGRVLGRLHALSREYARSHPDAVVRLPRWDDDRRLREAGERVPADDESFWMELRRLREWLGALPVDAGVFGPIHGDFGVTNYRVAGDTLTTFDFGDSCRHWYAYDIAVSVYPYGERPERRELLAATLEGYAAGSGAPLGAEWVNAIGWFCRLRLVYMYLVHTTPSVRLPRPQADAAWVARKREHLRRPVDWSV